MSDTENQTAGEEDLLERLRGAGKMAEQDRNERRGRQVRGSHLQSELIRRATEAGLRLEERSGFHKFVGQHKGPSLYVGKKGGRVDLSGFSIQSDGFHLISEEEARERHLGKVRCQLNFDRPDEVVLSSFDAAVEYVRTFVAPERPARAARERAAAPAEQPSEPSEPSEVVETPEAPQA